MNFAEANNFFRTILFSVHKILSGRNQFELTTKKIALDLIDKNDSNVRNIFID